MAGGGRAGFSASHSRRPTFCEGSLPRGHMVKYYASRETDEPTPHPRDQLYVVRRGSSSSINRDHRPPFSAGHALFVPAGMSHCVGDFTDDLGTRVPERGGDDLHLPQHVLLGASSSAEEASSVFSRLSQSHCPNLSYVYRRHDGGLVRKKWSPMNRERVTQTRSVANPRGAVRGWKWTATLEGVAGEEPGS